MSGTQLGYIKGKLGLKGETKTGEMISRMNLKLKEHSASAIAGMKKFINEESKEKLGSMELAPEKLTHHKCPHCGMQHKSHAELKAHIVTHHKSQGMCMKCGGMHKTSAHYKTSGIKKTGKSYGKSNRLGGGGRFQQVKHAVAGKKGVYNPAGLAAYIGRQSLGKARFQRLAAAGKKHHKLHRTGYRIKSGGKMSMKMGTPRFTNLHSITASKV